MSHQNHPEQPFPQQPSPNNPYGQQSGNDAYSQQPSPNAPYGQQGGNDGYPQHHTGASDPYGQPGVGGFGSSGQSVPSGPAAGQPSPAWAPAASASSGPEPSSFQKPAHAPQSAGFFRAMVDFRFEHFITVKFSAVLYIVAWIAAILLWGWNIVMGIVWGFAFAGLNIYSDSDFSAWPLVVAILFGWIPSILAIIVMRLGLEFSVAVVRTAQNTGALVEQKSGGEPAA